MPAMAATVETTNPSQHGSDGVGVEPPPLHAPWQIRSAPQVMQAVATKQSASVVHVPEVVVAQGLRTTPMPALPAGGLQHSCEPLNGDTLPPAQQACPST